MLHHNPSIQNCRNKLGDEKENRKNINIQEKYLQGYLKKVSEFMKSRKL